MSNEIETSMFTEDNVSVYVSEWDEGGAWLRLSDRHGSMNTALTRAEAQKLMEGLEIILAKEVTA